jgi:hypothetical protein
MSSHPRNIDHDRVMDVKSGIREVVNLHTIEDVAVIDRLNLDTNARVGIDTLRKIGRVPAEYKRGPCASSFVDELLK